MEWIDAEGLLRGREVKWNLIKFDPKVDLGDKFLCPISDTEILIAKNCGESFDYYDL